MRRAVAMAIRRQRLRRRPGCSQENLALEMEMDRSYFGALERGEHDPRLSTLCIVASALRIKASYLVNEIEQFWKKQS